MFNECAECSRRWDADLELTSCPDCNSEAIVYDIDALERELEEAKEMCNE